MQPVIRALRTLRTLAAARLGMTLQDLSDSLGIPLGSMHRLLAVLSAEHFVTRSPTTKRYFLGPAARGFDQAASGTTLVRPHEALQRAAAATGESVFLTELIGDRAICVALVDGVRPLRLFVRIGQEMPLHAAASARVLLSDAPDEVVRMLLFRAGLTPYTTETPNSVEEVLAHLAMIRARGFDICDDELDDGVWAVSAPVRTATGRVVGSVTMAAPGSQVSELATRDEATRTVVRAANEMAIDLGFDGPDHRDTRTGSKYRKPVEPKGGSS